MYAPGSNSTTQTYRYIVTNAWYWYPEEDYWWTPGVANGWHTIWVRADDINGNIGGSSLTVYVSNTTDVQQISDGVPSAFALTQNYPNPFNPETKIRYQLPTSSYVVFKIYDMLGREIRTLVNTEQQAGYYEATWDGKDDKGTHVSSGVYFYRIAARQTDGGQAADPSASSGQWFTDRKSMVLVK